MIRVARADELAELSAHCLRSKAHWDYDAGFIEACREDLTLHEADLGPGFVVWEVAGKVQATVRVSCADGAAKLSTLFIDPAFIGTGLGRVMFEWAVDYARGCGASILRLESEPFAVAFYQSMGAQVVGEVASAVFAGRVLPVMEYSLIQP